MFNLARSAKQAQRNLEARLGPKVGHADGRGMAAPTVFIERLEERLMLSLLGQQLYPAEYPWNQRITNAPTAANSAAIIGAIVANQGSNGRLHPDFGQDSRTSGADLYGIPYNVVHGNTTTKVRVVIDGYPDESDIQNAPIPAGAVIEGDMQAGPTVGVDNRGDSHLLVWDEDTNIAYEFYRASRPTENGDGKWHADCEAVWNMATNQFRTIGWTSVDAAGLSVLAGLVRPDEALPVSEGGQGVINHAIRFTLRNATILNQFIYPASHVANPGNTNPAVQPPMGARFRLKANVDISALSPESKVIAQAMKDYGMIVADNGSNFYFSGASYSVNASNGFALTWNDNDIQDTTHGLKSLHFSDFEVVDLTPVVTGVSPASGPAGTRVTITGQDFSGAAGHLQVLFGGAAATSLVVVDDTHVTAVSPAGTGVVDIRVQSGVSDSGDTQNIKNPIFGYGISAISSADRFTSALKGDMNGDGLVNGFDINPFVLGLTDPTAYATQYGPNRIIAGDINGDGLFNGFDISPFVTLLVAGAAAPASDPPTTTAAAWPWQAGPQPLKRSQALPSPMPELTLTSVISPANKSARRIGHKAPADLQRKLLTEQLVDVLASAQTIQTN